MINANIIDIEPVDISTNLIRSIKDVFSNRSPEKSRAIFDKLETSLLTLPQLDEDDFSLKEWQSGGMYCREITIPKGAMLTGRIYKRDHIEIMVSGDISIVSDCGISKRYLGHNTIEAKAGKRQAGYAHEETVWITINLCPDDQKERLNFTSVLTYNELDDFDFKNLLFELGITQEEMDLISDADDVVDMSEEYKHIYADNSDIHGFGLFTKRDINEGEIICPLRINEKRTIAGRYTNHSLFGNAEPHFIDGVFVYIANSDIKKGSEIKSNYRAAIEMRKQEGDL